MMFLIADSGSTKTNWLLSDNNMVKSNFTCKGLNPYYVTPDEIAMQIEKSFPAGIDLREIHNIYFYGAGCAAIENAELVKGVLQLVFRNAEIEVFSDLLGSARALFGHDRGIAGILGTGSNSCFYDGKIISKNIPGYGYILGDEGSGAQLGLKLIKLFVHDELPLKIREDFTRTFNLPKSDILDYVYRKPMPNRFFASFTKFIFLNIGNELIYKEVKTSFENFFDKYICRYDDYRKYKLKFSGSVAFRYAALINEVAKERDLMIDEIVKFPIDRLAGYHINEI